MGSHSSSGPLTCRATQEDTRNRGILYTLTELPLLRGLVPHIPHRQATLHGRLLSSSGYRDAEAEHRRTVGDVLLCVAHQLERDGPISQGTATSAISRSLKMICGTAFLRCVEE